MPTLPRPENITGTILGSLRVADLKYVIHYAKTITRDLPPPSRLHLKAEHITYVQYILKDFFRKNDRLAYECVLGAMRSLLRSQPEYTHYQWHANATHPIPTVGSWQQGRPPTSPSGSGRRTYAVSTGVPGAVPGGLVNAEFLGAAVSEPELAPWPVPQHKTGNSHRQSAGGFAGLVFEESSFISPVEKVSLPLVCPDTRSRTHVSKITFSLSREQASALETNVGLPEKEQYGVYLYMCGYSDACENSNNPTGRPATIEFPQSLSVAANGSPVHQAHSARGRSKSPISLTARINKVVGFKNTVQISYSSFARWVAAVVLAKHHTSKSIIGELRKTSFVSADAVRKQFFKGSDDDDVISAGALVSLKCPLGLSRINTPMRSRFCQHSQCFDGETFLQLNQQTPSWKCPICSISVKSWRELIVDGYFEAILMGTSPNDDQVHVDPDGSWKPKEAKPAVEVDASLANSKVADGADIEAIDLSDASNLGNQHVSRNKRRRTEVVDLTLDSDSDEGSIDLPPVSQEEIDLVNTATDSLLETQDLNGISDNNSDNNSSASAGYNSSTQNSTRGSEEPAAIRNLVSAPSAQFSQSSLIRVLQSAGIPASAASAIATNLPPIPLGFGMRPEAPAPAPATSTTEAGVAESPAVGARQQTDSHPFAPSSPANSRNRNGASRSSMGTRLGGYLRGGKSDRSGSSPRAARVVRRTISSIAPRTPTTAPSPTPPLRAQRPPSTSGSASRQSNTMPVRLPVSTSAQSLPQPPLPLPRFTPQPTSRPDAPFCTGASTNSVAVPIPLQPAQSKQTALPAVRSPVVGMSPTYTSLFLNAQSAANGASANPPTNGAAPGNSGQAL